MDSRLIYSIGHSSLSSEALIAHLLKFDVTCLLDVRRYPGSRRHPQFGRHALADTLSSVSVDYDLRRHRTSPYPPSVRMRLIPTSPLPLNNLNVRL